MTAEPDLLPLPTELNRPDLVGLHAVIQDHARACVAHATAARDAEIEALRAEVAEARDGWHMANGTADLAMKHRDAAEARAERLAGALRECMAFLPDRGLAGIAKDKARALLREQEEGRG